MPAMRRGGVAALVTAVAVAVAGCSTSTNGHGFGPTYTTVSGLGAQLAKGTNQLHSVRGTLHVESGPIDQTSTFSETLSQGNVSAMDDQVSTTYQGKTTELHMIIVGGTMYVDRSGRRDKPWVVATPQSSDPIVAQLAQNVQGTLSQSGMRQYVTMVSSGKDLQPVGPEQVDGVQCMHYRLSIDTRTAAQKLPGDQGKQMQRAADAGVDSIPMELWVDAGGRSIKLTDKVTAQGTTASIELRMNHLDGPVTIKPPSSDQISAG